MLDTLPEVRICVGYRLDGEPIVAPPAVASVYERVEPVYEVLPGWQADTSSATSVDDLPPNARRYLERIEELLGVPVTMVGVGPGRQQLLHRQAGAAV